MQQNKTKMMNMMMQQLIDRIKELITVSQCQQRFSIFVFNYLY